MGTSTSTHIEPFTNGDISTQPLGAPAAFPPTRFPTERALTTPIEPPAYSSFQRDPPEDWYADVGLPRITARYLWWGLSANTRRTYSTARNSYTTFAAFAGIEPFPPTADSLCNWMAYLGDRGRTKSATMKSYLTGLRSYCVDMGMDDLDVFRHPRVQRVIRGINIFHGAREGDRRERLPITRDLLLRILTRLDTHTQEGATYHAAFCTAFAAFLRVGEFTWTAADLSTADFCSWHITRRSVQFAEDDSRAYLTLPASKTDPFRIGITITIAAAPDAACPVKSLRHLFEKHPLPSYSPLFTLTGAAPDPAFTRTKVINRLRDLLLELGIPGNYSGHSFRRGAATWARSIGIPDADLQLLGRWKSDAYKRYIEVHPEHVYHVSRRLQTLPPPPEGH
jgi:integrase